MLRSLLKTTSLFAKDPVFRGLLFAALAALVTGSIFYHYVEGWSWVDSFYFCTITLATVGYGDFVPTEDATRIFTIFYVMFGAGIFATFVTAVAVVRLQQAGATRDLALAKGMSMAQSLERPLPGEPVPPRRYQKHPPRQTGASGSAPRTAGPQRPDLAMAAQPKYTPDSRKKGGMYGSARTPGRPVSRQPLSRRNR